MKGPSKDPKLAEDLTITSLVKEASSKTPLAKESLTTLL